MFLFYLYPGTVCMSVPRDEFTSVDWGQTNTKRKKDEKALESQIGFLKGPKLQLIQLELKWIKNTFKRGTKANKKKIDLFQVL